MLFTKDHNITFLYLYIHGTGPLVGILELRFDNNVQLPTACPAPFSHPLHIDRCIRELLRESLPKTGPLRFASESRFPFNLPMNICWSKSNWNGISFWKYFKIRFFGTKMASAPSGQFFAVEKSKNRAYCRVYHFKVFHLQWFFSLPRFKLVLKRCKAHNFEPSKATHV